MTLTKNEHTCERCGALCYVDECPRCAESSVWYSLFDWADDTIHWIEKKKVRLPSLTEKLDCLLEAIADLHESAYLDIQRLEQQLADSGDTQGEEG